MSGNGMGATFISDKLVQKAVPDPSLFYYKLREEDAARYVYFYHKQSRYVTRAMEEFMKIAWELCASDCA